MNWNSLDLTRLILFQMVQIVCLAAAVGIVVRLFARQRPQLAYLLWMLVIVKSLTPPIGMAGPLLMSDWDRSLSRWVTAAIPLNESVEPVSMPILLGNEAEAVAVAESQPTPDAPIHEETAGFELISISYPEPSSPKTLLTPWSANVLVAMWLIGGGLFALMILMYRLMTRQRIVRQLLSSDFALKHLLQELCCALGLRQKVRVKVTGSNLGPACVGFWRPEIVMPQVTMSPSFRPHLRAVLAHELMHIRRLDHVWSQLQVLAQVVWWFCPVIWWVNRAATRERERCCDEAVVAQLQREPEEYAQSLLEVLRLKKQICPVTSAPGIRTVDINTRRLEHIMKQQRPFQSRTPLWCWGILITVGLLVLPSAGPADDDTSAQKKDRDSREARYFYLEGVQSEDSDESTTVNELIVPALRSVQYIYLADVVVAESDESTTDSDKEEKADDSSDKPKQVRQIIRRPVVEPEVKQVEVPERVRAVQIIKRLPQATLQIVEQPVRVQEAEPVTPEHRIPVEVRQVPAQTPKFRVRSTQVVQLPKSETTKSETQTLYAVTFQTKFGDQEAFDDRRMTVAATEGRTMHLSWTPKNEHQSRAEAGTYQLRVMKQEDGSDDEILGYYIVADEQPSKQGKPIHLPEKYAITAKINPEGKETVRVEMTVSEAELQKRNDQELYVTNNSSRMVIRTKLDTPAEISVARPDDKSKSIAVRVTVRKIEAAPDDAKVFPNPQPKLERR